MPGLCCWLATLVATATATAAPFDPQPWLDDLGQVEAALLQKYANLDWLTVEREIDLRGLVTETATRLRQATSDTDARGAMERLVRKIRDGHVALHWPRAATGGAPAGVCQRLGYDAAQAQPGLTPSLPGYVALPDAANVLPAGVVTVGQRRVGVLRLGVFQVQGYPPLCAAGLAALSIAPDAACDEACRDRLQSWAYARLTEQVEGRLRQLRQEGATVLLLDIGDNGGGSEWVEAVARMVSRRPLTSAALGFVRGAHWSQHWAEVAAALRQAAASAPVDEARRLSAWATEADAARRQAERPCEPGAPCPIGRAGYATGLVGTAAAAAFAGKPWGARVFTPAQYPYHDAVWSGPVIVLTDEETWSAAEEIAAELQDGGAAIVFGARTGGAGCGHTGEPPTVLLHSGAVLELPDCARFRRDGSNEVAGVVPDVLVGLRAGDGRRRAAAMLHARLPEAVARAVDLDAR